MGELRGGVEGNIRTEPLATKCYNCYTHRMSRTISQRELRNDSAAVLRAVQAGESFLVARNGLPVAELRPIAVRRFVSREELRRAQRTASRVDYARFQADIDAIVDQAAND